uniref:Uncharacterized protein n=1 Tax=Strongyloides stercoralis TaxID=6248 RepID=A0AAF5DNE9_STRER
KDNDTNGNNFEKENISIDAPFNNCLDESIEDEDSYVKILFRIIVRLTIGLDFFNVLEVIKNILKLMITFLTVFNKSLSNSMVVKKTCEIYLDLLKDVDEVHEKALQSSTEYNGINIVIKNELMNNNGKHENYYFDRTTEYCIKFEAKFLRVYFILLSTITISCSEEETELKVFSIYDRFNYFSKSFDENIFCAAMLTDIVYLCELICRNPEKYSTEMFKSLENLTNYSNDNLEYKNTYLKYLERLLEYITTENSDFSPLFEIFAIKIVGMLNSKIQINKSSLENLYFISEANIDFHGIKLFDLRKTIIFLLNYISNLLNTFTDCYSSFKHNKILQKKYKLNVIFQYILSNVINSKYKVFMTFPSLLCNSNSVSKNSAVLFGIKKRNVDKYTLGNTQVPNKKKEFNKIIMCVLLINMLYDFVNKNELSQVYFSLILLKYQILAVIYIITKKLISLVPDDEQINLKNKF